MDWYLLAEKSNLGMKNFVSHLLKLYRKYPAMYEFDSSWDGFEWMNADDSDRSVYSFVRRSSTGRNSLLFVINMTPMRWEGYQVPVPKKKKYTLVLNGDDFAYGGNGAEIPDVLVADEVPCRFMDYSITFDLPPYGVAVFVF